jgi:hypothetical protein
MVVGQPPIPASLVFTARWLKHKKTVLPTETQAFLKPEFVI